MARLRYLTAGESHGEMLAGILEGVPSGLSLIAGRDIDPALAARQTGYGRGRRQKIETDRARIISGVRFGATTGSPIAILIENKDWKNWQDRMSIEPGENERPVTIPRPGHADLAGAIKYGHESEIRNVLERASARETAMRVAIGAIATKLLHELGIESIGYVTAIGGIVSEPDSVEEALASITQIEASELRLVRSDREAAMIERIDRAKAAGDTVGGTVECVVRGVPPGIGSHVHWDRKLDAAIAQAVMSVQAVKAVEIGAGVSAAQRLGSEVHDAIEFTDAKLHRSSNNAGGIEGGMSNGEPIVVRAHMKPISTLMQPLHSVDLATMTATDAHIERSDVCAVPALSVIVEHVVTLAIASELVDTFGGDTVAELQERVRARRLRLSPSQSA